MLSRKVRSIRTGEQVREMADGTHMSWMERLDYAVRLVPREQWQARFHRSVKQLDRYLAGNDVPLSILRMIAAVTGVPLDWIVCGRPTHGPSTWDEWRVGLSGQEFAVPLRVADPEKHQQSFDLAKGPALPGPPRRFFAVREPNSERWPSRTYVAIPRYNVAASAGGGALEDNEQIVEYIAYEEQYIRNKLGRAPECLLLVEARGDSMEPIIRDGDVLTVDITAGQAVEHGGLYVLRIGDNLLVKRVEQRLASLVLHSENARYAPETIARADTEQLHILGRVLLITAPPR